MDEQQRIFSARVMHRRFTPRENAFSYGIYNLLLPLPASPIPSFVQRFDAHDVGWQDGRDPKDWALEILCQHGLKEAGSNITLLTMPRVFGYVFNPVSFYFCRDAQGALRAIICEVHNTFGGRHSYVCAHPDKKIIEADDWLEAKKLFHVSPFFEREGYYRFRFDVREQHLGIWIDYYNDQHEKQLATSLIGRLFPLTPQTLRMALFKHPAVTLKAILLIHWQALKLVWKRAKYVSKPPAFEEKTSATRQLTKM